MVEVDRGRRVRRGLSVDGEDEDKQPTRHARYAMKPGGSGQSDTDIERAKVGRREAEREWFSVEE